MKLASLKGGRDGRLIVVSRDLTRAADAGGIAPTLQAALDDWDRAAPALADLAAAVEHDLVSSFAFDEHGCASPLPRAYQWADGSAYPLIYQGGSDCFLAPGDPIVMAEEAWGIDMEGEVAVITGDVPMGASPARSAAAIRLIMLVNDVSLRNLIPGELAKGFGFFQSKPSSAFSPVAVTPDELGEAWNGSRLSLPLSVDINGKPFGRANTGADMTFEFPTLIAHAAKTRRLAAGTIVGSGTVSNRDEAGGPGKPVEEGGAGYSCIAEIRMVETITKGRPMTPFLHFGDRVRIEMRDSAGLSIFGAIEQEVERYAGP